MERRKSAFEQAQEAALSFALDEEDDVSVISFESSSGIEEGDLNDNENTNNANLLPKSTNSTYSAHKGSHLTLPTDSTTFSNATERNLRSSQQLDDDEQVKYQWARAHALASAMQTGSSEDDDDFSAESSTKSEDSASMTGPKPPKRKNSFANEPSKADEIFSQMQKGEFIFPRRSLPPSLTRYESGESTCTNKSAQSIKSFPLTVKRTMSQSSSYRDPRHRKDYGRQISFSLTRPTPNVARANSVGNSVSSMSTSSLHAASLSDTSKEKKQERMAESQFRQSFIRTMEERLQMRTTIKELRYDEENQHRHQHQETEEEEEQQEEDKPPSENGIVTAETRLVPTSVHLSHAESVADSAIHERRKMVKSAMVFALLAIIAAATISILVVVLSQKGRDGPTPMIDEDPIEPPPTTTPEVVSDQVIAVVPRTICMEQVPGDGWSTQCNAEQSILQGGGVCNLVAQSFLEQVEAADIAFQSSTACLGDIVMGNFTVADAYQILPHNERLWNIEVTGLDILTVLEQVLEATFGVNKGKRDYPYAAGLRFAVNASAPYMSRVLDPEVNRRLEQFAWEPLDLEATYTVVANRDLLIGGTLTRNTPYEAFEQAYKDQFPKGKTWMQTTTTFIEFAEKEKVLRDPPLDTYSTTLFIP